MKTFIIRLILIAFFYVLFRYIIFNDHVSSLLSSFVSSYVLESLIQEKIKN